jgi:hypothetical protein
MKTKKCLNVPLIFLLALLVVTGTAQALELTKDGTIGTIEINGKVETKLTFRTEGSEGFTSPHVETGHMVQHRNVAYLELRHDLKYPTGLDLKYRVVGRFFYDGVFDYGPSEFRDVRRANKDKIDDFKMDGELWEGYVDFAKGPLFLRMGRQNLAWGETDVFRLLDGINPLDNTFGFVYENLDDRRIPLWMFRGSYNFGKVLGISSLTLEGFWNPGFAGQKVAPIGPSGTPYVAPLPSLPIGVRTIKPDDTMQNSRWGLRLQGLIAENFNFSLAHYQSFPDNPAGRIVFYPGFVPVQELVFKKVDVTGGSLSFFEPHILRAIVRSEVAWFWNEPVFIPQINTPLLFGNFVDGKIPNKDVLRFMVGIDKAFWIKPLNNLSMINFSVQYFGEWYQNFDDRMRVPITDYPSGRFLDTKRYNHTATLLCWTSYLHGTLNPQIAAAYDLNGAWLFMPSLEYIWEPFRIKLEYSAIYGKFTGFGIFRDRDQISLRLTYLF